MSMDEAIKQNNMLMASQLAFGGSAEDLKAFYKAFKEVTK